MPKFVSIEEAIKPLMLLNDDYLQRSKGKLLTVAKMVWQDLNLTTVKEAERELFQINKRTNTVDLPFNTTDLCSVSVIGRNGVIYPLYRNDRLHKDIIDISAKKDCGCEKGCGYKLCATLSNYEAIQSTKSDHLPDGTPISFVCKDRKMVDKNGWLISETQYPLRVYTSGIWTNTVLHTEVKRVCALEVNSDGCVCDTEGNIDAVVGSCLPNAPVGGTASTPPSPNVDTWMYYSGSKLDWISFQSGCRGGLVSHFKNIYNISETGDRLIFPHDFPFDSVLIRRYADQNLFDIRIPIEALPTFMTGVKWFETRWNDKMQKLAMKYEIDYSKQKWGLLLELNKYTIAEIEQAATPHVNVPSYIHPRH